MEQQIALTHAATQHYLDGIDAAGIIFRNANHLFVVGKFQLQQFDGIQAGFITDGQATAFVAVKCYTIVPSFHIHTP